MQRLFRTLTTTPLTCCRHFILHQHSCITCPCALGWAAQYKYLQGATLIAFVVPDEDSCTLHIFPCQLLYFHWSSFTASQINRGLTQIFSEAQWGTVVPRSAVCASGSAGRYKRGNVAQGVGCCVQEGSGSLVADLQPASLLLFFF